jgi:glycosyltransferase involved in cell wall biosynthesis
LKPKLLFLSAHLPSPHATQAGQLTAYRNLVHIAAAYDVHLIAYRNEVELGWDLNPLLELCSSVKVVDITYLDRVKNSILKFYLPLHVSIRSSKIFKKYIFEKTSEINFSRVHFEWTQMISYSTEFNSSILKSLCIHDVLSQAALRKISWLSFFLTPFYLFEFFRTYLWEKIFLGGMDILFAPSEKDKKILLRLVSNLEIKVVPLAFRLFENVKRKASSDHLTLLYWGSYAREENVDAVLYLIKKIFPLLKAKGIPCKLLILGSHPPSKLRQYAGSDIFIPGFIDNPSEMFSLAHMAVFPIRFGAGVKVKVLESLSAGLPVVTTFIGSEGIPCDENSGLFTIDKHTPVKFVTKILEIYSNEFLMHRISINAKMWATNYAEIDPTILY